MPKAFDDCNKGGGRIRTLTSGKNKGRLICFPKGGGSGVLGEVRTQRPESVRQRAKRRKKEK